MNECNSSTPCFNLNRRLAGYAIGDVIGIGAFGEVRLGQSIQTGQIVAVKIIDQEKLRDTLDREIEILRSIQHSNIVRVIDVIENIKYTATWCRSCACTQYEPIGALARCRSCSPHSTSHHCIEETRSVTLVVQELAMGGELLTILMQCGALPEGIARVYFRQLLNGLQHCHRNGIVHRDLKPENLVLDHELILKIVDFGLAASVINDGDDDAERAVPVLSPGIGSIPYSAPEAHFHSLDADTNHKQYLGEPADIWSCAVILFIMLTGRPPFRRPLQRTVNSVNQRCSHFTALMNGHYPECIGVDARNLLQSMFHLNPAARPSIDAILNHSWVQRDIPDQRIVVQHMRNITMKSWTKQGKNGMAFILRRLFDQTDCKEHNDAIDDDEQQIQQNCGNLERCIELSSPNTVDNINNNDIVSSTIQHSHTNHNEAHCLHFDELQFVMDDIHQNPDSCMERDAMVTHCNTTMNTFHVVNACHSDNSDSTHNENVCVTSLNADETLSDEICSERSAHDDDDDDDNWRYALDSAQLSMENTHDDIEPVYRDMPRHTSPNMSTPSSSSYSDTSLTQCIGANIDDTTLNTEGCVTTSNTRLTHYHTINSEGCAPSFNIAQANLQDKVSILSEHNQCRCKTHREKHINEMCVFSDTHVSSSFDEIPFSCDPREEKSICDTTSKTNNHLKYRRLHTHNATWCDFSQHQYPLALSSIFRARRDSMPSLPIVYDDNASLISSHSSSTSSRTLNTHIKDSV